MRRKPDIRRASPERQLETPAPAVFAPPADPMARPWRYSATDLFTIGGFGFRTATANLRLLLPIPPRPGTHLHGELHAGDVGGLVP